VYICRALAELPGRLGVAAAWTKAATLAAVKPGKANWQVIITIWFIHAAHRFELWPY
jgi:hypothetical protein